jgi:hypothetical protein
VNVWVTQPCTEVDERNKTKPIYSYILLKKWTRFCVGFTADIVFNTVKTLLPLNRIDITISNFAL